MYGSIAIAAAVLAGCPVFPADNHWNLRLPAMGQRLRLKRGFDISRFPHRSRVVLTALKRYGMILADNGSSRYVSGAPSRGWDNGDLHSLHGVPGSAFEVVDSSRLRRP